MENFIKPKAKVLSEESYVPSERIISPAPNQFTHKLLSNQPYYFQGPQQQMPPNGEFLAKTNVILIRYDGGSYCWVADEQGIFAEIEYSSLKKL